MRYRPVVLTLVALLTAWGMVTFATMPRREDPEFTIRTCVVSTQWPGAPTVKVEELITDKIEEALDSIEDVDYLNSETTNGQSIIYVNLDDSVSPADIPNVWDKVRAKVEMVEMPAAGIRPAVNDEFGDTSILLLGVYQTPIEGQTTVHPDHQYTARELEIHADRVRDAIRLLPGVAKVEKHGVQGEAVFIETDLGTWSQIDLTTQALRALVQNRNIVSPGGSIDTAQGKFHVRPGGEFNVVSEINSLTVGAVTNGSVANRVSLQDIGLSVNRDYLTPPQVICRFTDEQGTYPAVMLGVTMKSGANIIDICNAAMNRVAQLENVDQALPRDLAVRPVSNLADNVSRKISDVVANVISAIVIVVIVVYLFVGLRTALVMAANIPLVVLASVAVIRQFGVQLEQISLASIIIALGLLVDNAVQVCDQTRTNILDGMSPADAAVKGANLLMFPMLSGTLTTIAAFFPMLIALEGGGAEYVYSLPVTLSTTLLISWFFAMTICVILAAAFIRAPRNPDVPSAPLPWLSAKLGTIFQKSPRQPSSAGTTSERVPTKNHDNLFLRLYGQTAHVATSFKWISTLVAVAILGATLQLPVSSEFFPVDRRDQFLINVRLPETSTIAETNRVVTDVENAIKALSPYQTKDGQQIERLRSMRSLIGQGGARWALGIDPPPPGPNTAEILIRTTDGLWTEQFVEDIRQAAEQGNSERGIGPIVGARIIPKKLALGPPSPPVELRVSGDGFADINRLRHIAEQVRAMIRDEPGTWDVYDSWGIDGFQLNVNINDEKANLSGVTNAAVADTLNAYYSGLKLTDFREGDHSVPVFFRLRAEDRQDLSGLDTAFVEGENGKVPLNSVASVVPTWQPGKIERRNQNRTINVSAEVEEGISGNDIVLRVWNSERMESLKASLPNGYRIEIGGALEESQESSAQMMTSFAISIVTIVLILVIQYNGWSKTLVILATLPLAVVGAWFGLWLTNNPLGFMPQLGLLSLFGIVLNTGIIFIEFADALIAEKRQELLAEDNATGRIAGLSRSQFRQCLVDAGKQRMLPIFLTTATTIGGLFPLALSGGPLWEGMAWLMIFGLIVATLLTLYIVPSLYAIVVESFRVAPVAIAKTDD